MAISKLTIPTRTAASSTGYAGDMNLVIAKINELATSMAISPLTIAAAVGAGNPAADMNQVVAKINELIGGGTTTPPASTLAITSIDPSSAKAGDTIILTGSGFTGVLNVLFAGVAAGSGKFSVLSDTQITVTVPNVSAGSNPVQVVGSSATSSARAFIVQAAAANVIPVASANSPAAITLPANQVALNGTGTDSDGTVVAYEWRQVTGPVSAVGMPATTQNVVVSGLSTAGTYQFGFKVKDDKGAYSTEQFVNVTVKAAVVIPGYDGRPWQDIPFGDSRTANEGFDNATSEAGGWRTKMETLANQGDGAGHHVVRKDSGYPSTDTVFALSAVNAGGFFSSRRDTTTYYGQAVSVWFGVNDKGQNADRTVGFVLDNLRQIYQALAAMGFLPIAVTEPPNKVQAAYPDWFSQLNAGIEANYLAWGCVDIVRLHLEASIANMKDKTISGDELHYTDYGNTLLAPPFLKVHNRVAASRGVPTSDTSGGGGGATKPAKPTIVLSGRTFAATAGNGLASSTLRYTVNGGAVQTGSTYTVPDASALAAGALSFYSVATGNYLQSDAATNTDAVAAVATSAFYNSSFDTGFAANANEGMFRSNDFGEGSPNIIASKRVILTNGVARFNGQQYEGISQVIKTTGGAPGPAGNYRATVIVTSKTGGGRWSLQNTVIDQGKALNGSITAVGTFTFDFTTAIAGEAIFLKAEDDGVIGDVDVFNVEPR
jgi:hypothetical protein